jgi:hypothetical protein
MWVRLPPRAPFYLHETSSVNATTSALYPAFTPYLREEEPIAAPCVGQISFQLFLPCTYPRRVMFLCDANTCVSQEDRHPLCRYATE